MRYRMHMPDSDGLPFHTLLYQNPEIYNKIFPDKTSSPFVLRAIKQYSKGVPSSVVDFGCGTGSTLEVLARTILVCVGVDLIPAMLEYGRRVRPNLDLRVGDMRTARLGRTFDVIVCFGWAFSYALTDHDVEAVLETFRQHAYPGTVLAFDCGGADWYLERKDGLPDIIMDVDVPGFKARSVSHLDLDPVNLVLTRRRIWYVDDGKQEEDYTRYRLHKPDELKGLLESKGFIVKEMGLDPTGKQQAPGERTLYLVASAI